MSVPVQAKLKLRFSSEGNARCDSPQLIQYRSGAGSDAVHSISRAPRVSLLRVSSAIAPACGVGSGVGSTVGSGVGSTVGSSRGTIAAARVMLVVAERGLSPSRLSVATA